MIIIGARRNGMHRGRTIAALVLAAALIASVLSVVAGSDRAAAADGRDFNAGNIISDGAFYNPGTMNVDQIQAFLNAKRPNCAAGRTCLKDYQESFATRQADARCGYLQGQRMSAAAIIYWVGQACGINPQALLVLLEKEQGLVSASSPSANAYRIAMGYGCPDTAPCDALYYGFFNQVYSAARQFKVYQASPNSFRYRAGRSNDIQWHPNAGCGISSVYIENQATAGLYNYTPYRPNAAALGNMYGTGDGCSAYGNRNFWRIFSDWFGSTTGGGSDFARTASDPKLYLLVGSSKHYVPTGAVFSALAPLGTYRTVSAEYLAGFSNGKQASEVVRDPQSGEVSLAQEGQRHRFASCDLVVVYGFTCAEAVDLAPTQLSRLPSGGEVGAYFRVGSEATVYTLIDGKKTSFTSLAAIDARAGVRPSYFASMRAEVAARYPRGRTFVAPMSLVKSATSPTVYLVDGWDRKIPIASFASASELGVRGYREESAAVLDSYSTAPAPLSFVVRCETGIFVAGSGRLTRIASGDPAGVAVTDISPYTCGRVPKTPNEFSGAIFVKSTNSPTVSMLRGRQLEAVPDYSSLVAINGGASPAIAQLDPVTIGGLPSGPALLPPGRLVRTPEDPTIYLIDGVDQRIPVSSLAVTGEFGLTSWSSTDSTALNRYRASASAVSPIWSCAGTSYFGASGTAYALGGTANTGLAVTNVSPITCASIRRSADAPLPRLFVIAAGSPTVHVVEKGMRRTVSSWDALLRYNGGATPRILTVSSTTISGLAVGAPI